MIVAAVFLDAFMTTVSVSAGAGPLTSRLLGLCWRVMLRLHRQDKESSFLTAAGVVLLSVTVLAWVLLLWTGWAMMFAGSDAVVHSRTQAPAGTADVIYYTGFTIFTLGTGDFVASTSTWRVATAAASFTGLFLVTLSITYLISVVSAVVMRRALAVQIHALGRSTTDIVVRGWTGTRFSTMFEQQLIGLTPNVVVSGEQHLAYPVLHYFHASSEALAAPQAVVRLDEALTLLSKGVSEAARPDPNAVEPLRYAIDRHLRTANATSWSPDVDAPPAPSLQALADAGIPHTAASSFADETNADRDRRTALHRLLVSDGWSWPST